MKLSFDQKVQIYREWKSGMKSIAQLAREYNITSKQNVSYIVHLAEAHGTEILRHKWTYYSPEFKIAAVRRVLIDSESSNQVSIELGLSNQGTLSRWVKEFLENDCIILEKKKGRKPHESQEQKICQGSRNGETDSGKRKAGKTTGTPEEAERNIIHKERILKKIKCLGPKAGPEEIVQAVTELRQETKRSLAFILEAIKSDPSLPSLPRSDYYYYMSRKDPDWKYDELMNAIIRIFYEHKERYGYRRITLQLFRQGFTVNHKTVKRLMTKMGLYGKTPRAKYRSYRGKMNGTTRNLLLAKEVDEISHRTVYVRNFKTSAPDEKWTTDVSEFRISAGKLYLSPILDMHTSEIVSYNISRRPDFQQIEKMLDEAFEQREDLAGLILHSDQGWQYQMKQYRRCLQEHGIIQSMSRKGNCLDNCVMENFFGKLKNEMFYGHEYEFETLEELEQAIREYIDYYNNQRIQVRLKGLTPCEARNQALGLVR